MIHSIFKRRHMHTCETRAFLVLSLMASSLCCAPWTGVEAATSSDLRVSSVVAPNGTYAAGTGFNVLNRTYNDGPDDCPGYTVRLYASTNTIISTADTLIGTYNRSALANGSNDYRNSPVTLPSSLAPGSYYIGMIVSYDNDPSTGNNSGYDGTRITVVQEADLRVSLVNAPSGMFAPGESFTVENQTINDGPSDCSGYAIKFYASTNTIISTADTQIASYSRGALAKGAAYHINSMVTLPGSLPHGFYYIGAIVTFSGDPDTANNSGYDGTSVAVDSLDVTNVSPNSGPGAGGTVVNIDGESFVSGTTVTFGGTAASNVSVISATRIKCTTPAHADGTVDVVVTKPNGLNATLTGGFTYSTNNPPDIDSGPNSSDANADVGVEITFSASASDPDGDPITYTWDFGDGNAGTGDTATHTYDTPGTYTVRVTVEDDKGASVSATLTQIVKDPTGVTITRLPSAEPTTAVEGATVTFFVKAESPANPINYTWNFGDGSPEETTQNLDISHAYATAGAYTATVTATDANGKTATAEVSVTITEPGGGGLASAVLRCTTVKLKINFVKPDKDMVSVKGTIEIPDGFDPNGMEVRVDISGVFGHFRLDAKGKAKTDINGDKNKKFMVKVKYKKGVLQTGETKFTMVFKKGNFRDAWAQYGAVNETINQRIGIPVTITSTTHVYSDSLVGDYRATVDRSGKFAGKEGLTLGGF